MDSVRDRYRKKCRKLKLIVRDLTERIGRELSAREDWQREKDALLAEIRAIEE